MALVNIRRDVTDPFYRYKMERLQSKIEGKGNGIKTVVVNLSRISQSLARPPSYVIKYFGFELGAQTNINPSDDRWIINGAHDASKLQDYLDGFISKFVLCKKCKNPETDIQIKDTKILLDCRACGQRTEVDLRLKLSSFILKNQPRKGKKDKLSKKADRRARKDGVPEVGEDSPKGSPHDSSVEDCGDLGNDDNDGSDDNLTRKINAEAKEFIRTVDNEEIKWSVDTSEEAVKARAKELPADLKRALVINDEDDEEGEGGTAYDALATWIMENRADKNGVGNIDDIEIYLKAKELGIATKHKTLTVLGQYMFDEGIVKQIGDRKSMLIKMISDSDRHQKAFLGGLERFLGKDKPGLIGQLPAILMKLYDNDIITESVIKAWGTKASKKYVDLSTSRRVRKAAENFIEWLENAESDDSSEEDNE